MVTLLWSDEDNGRSAYEQPLIPNEGGTLRVQWVACDRGSGLMNLQCRVTGPASSDSYHLLCKELIWLHSQ
jgi:hypothetical protein